MKELSQASGTKLDKDCSMSSLTLGTQWSLPLFVTVESIQPSKETTLSDKSSLWDNSTPLPKLSKTSVVDSISKGKVFAPYWTGLCEEISSKLLLPVGIDSVDSDSSCFNIWSNKTVEKSWFSTKLFTAPKPSLQPIFSPCDLSSLAGCTDSEVTLNKSRKIRIFLNSQQKQILKHWYGVSRYVYNRTIAYLQQPDTQASWLKIKKGILDELPEWASTVPFQVKSIAIKDACQAVKMAKKGYKTDAKVRKCKFRSRRDKKQTIYIPKSAIREKGIYPTLLGELSYTETLPRDFSDGRLSNVAEEYYLVVSEKVQPIKTENQGRVVSLDPGVRKMFTFFSEDSFGFLGVGANLFIQKLCVRLDDLISKISKAKCRQKRRLKKAADRIRAKIKNSIAELHHKIAHFLVTNFDVILLPTFETSEMVSRFRRRLRAKSVRQMLTLSHYQFKEFLRWKCLEYKKCLFEVSEAYTSKTVSWTGELVKVGGSEKIKSPSTGITLDRDLNGARGIFLRALVDTPSLRDCLNVSIS